MTTQQRPFGGADSMFRNRLPAGAGALTGRRNADRGAHQTPVTPATDDWVNEGGACVAPGDDAAPEESPPPPHRSTRRAPGATPEWCRQRAAADLVAAGEMDTVNGRLRFEHSAVSWTARADLLQRLEDRSAARRIASLTFWPGGATPPAAHGAVREPKEPIHVRL